MKKIFLLIAASFAFLSAFSLVPIHPQLQADRIVIERMSQEDRLYFIYAKEGEQRNTIITTSEGEELELNYPCFVYYVQYADVNCICGRYLIVHADTYNLLEIDTTDKGTPSDLEEWRHIDRGSSIAFCAYIPGVNPEQRLCTMNISESWILSCSM